MGKEETCLSLRDNTYTYEGGKDDKTNHKILRETRVLDRSLVTSPMCVF